MQFDEIVVGSGSSGAVVAARLSEDSWRKVLLLEAGPDYPNVESTPESLLNGRQVAGDHDWGFTAEMVEGQGGLRSNHFKGYPRGKVIGGSSSVNACIALRGTPADYDEWRAFGIADWDWAKVLPVLMQIEDDQDEHGEFHGLGGPLPIRRLSPADLCPAQAAFVAACGELGFPAAHDNNHPEATGVGSGPWNLGSGSVRISTAIAYLLPARGRQNLTIRSDCLVNRVLFDGKRAIGVEVECEGGSETILAERVTLSGGAIGSPAILLRTGIGPAEDLKALGVEPQVSLNGVGRNLIDHAFVGVSWETAPGIVDENSPFLQVVLRYTAPGSSQANDMQAIPFQALPQPAVQLGVALMKPHSRGTLRLVSKDPEVQPDIRLNLASDAEDVRRLGEGLKLIGRFVQTPQLADLGARAVTLYEGETIPAEQFVGLLGQDDWVNDYVRSFADDYVHPVGTARMGSANDPGAVVDRHGRVHGTSGLRVADASVMPTIPRANTNLTCIMIGERVAAWMREEDD